MKKIALSSSLCNRLFDVKKLFLFSVDFISIDSFSIDANDNI